MSAGSLSRIENEQTTKLGVYFMDDNIEEEFNIDLPEEPTNADLDNIETGNDTWEWESDQIVFDDEPYEI
jgi:hypothetical protein